MNRAARRRVAHLAQRATASYHRTRADLATARAVVRGVGTLGGLMLGWPWDPIVSWFSDVGSSVKDFVSSALASLQGWVVDGLDAVYTWGGNVFNAIWGTFDQVWWTFTSVWSWITNIVETAIPAIWGGINGAIGFVVSQADAIYQWASDAVAAVYGYIANAVDGVFSWVIDNVWNPILGFFDQVYGYIASMIDGVFSWVVDNVWNPIMGMVTDIYDRFANIWGWLTTVVVDVVNLVHGAWDWLVIAARYTYGFTFQLVDDITNHSPRWWANAMTQSLYDHPGSVDSWLERLVG